MKTKNVKQDESKESKRNDLKEIKRKLTWLAVYKDPMDMLERNISDLQLERIAKELLIWAKKEESFAINEFYTEKHIPTTTWYDWIKKSEALGIANALAKEIIGIRNAKFVTIGKYRSDMIKQVQGHYCPIWRSEHDRITAMNNEPPVSRPQEITLNIMPSTDIVPILVKND